MGEREARTQGTVVAALRARPRTKHRAVHRALGGRGLYSETSHKEAIILKIEQNGPEVCSTPANSSFILVDIPLHVVGDGPRGEAEYRYRIGTFVGRVVSWSLEKDPRLVARMRIPDEKFRSGEELALEVLAKGSGVVLWRKSWRAAWQGNAPAVEPAGPDRADTQADPDGRTRFYRSGS